MKTRTLAAFGVASALGVTGAGVGIAAAQTNSTPTTAKSSTSQPAATGQNQAPANGQCGPGQGGRGGPGGNSEELAAALGISETTLQTAMDKVRPSTPPSATATDAQRAAARTAQDTALAKELKITVDQLHAAQGQALVSHVQTDVTEGHLTQAQADQIKALVEKGDLQGAQTAMRNIRDTQHLTQMVKNKEITQAQADQIAAKVKAGAKMPDAYKAVTGKTMQGPGRGPGNGQPPTGQPPAAPANSSNSSTTPTTAG